MQRYESYKPSGIQWVEKIPSHWGAERAKWLFNRMERPVRPEDDVVTAFRDGQVTLRTNRRTEGFTNAIQEHGYQGIRKGDLVIHAMDAFAGAIGVSDSDGKSTPVYAACVPRGEYPINSYYYAYLLRYMAHSGYIESLSKGIRERSTDFRFAEFRELPLPIPDQDEQDCIVAFLDQKTAEIDAAIAKKERLIELMQEQKGLLINHAVTCGLNHNVPMRDDGELWFGRAPDHWRRMCIKHLKATSKNSFVDGPFGSNLKSEHFVLNGDVYVVESGHVTTGVFKDGKAFKTITSKHFKTIERSSCKGGDIIIAKIGANYGMNAILPDLDKPAVVSGNSLKLTVNQKLVDVNFAHYLLLVAKSRGAFESIVNASAQPALSLGGLNNVPVLLPPMEEQVDICTYCAQVESLTFNSIKSVLSQILKLIEFKSILVSDVISGRIKV